MVPDCGRCVLSGYSLCGLTSSVPCSLLGISSVLDCQNDALYTHLRSQDVHELRLAYLYNIALSCKVLQSYTLATRDSTDSDIANECG